MSANEVYVGAAATATALGDSLDALWRALCAGESAVGPIERFSTDALDFHNAASAALPEPAFDAGGNRTTQLMQRALDQLGEVPENTCVVWTGVKGNAESVEAVVESDAPDAALQRPYLAWHYHEWIRKRLGLGDCPKPQSGAWTVPQSVNAACASSTVGLAMAAHRIASGEANSVLVCAADIVSRFTFMGFSALKALSPTTPRPFDEARDGLALGDGAAAVWLANGATLDATGAKPLGRLTGWGVANDANHITGPARDGSGLIRAIRSALDQAGLAADEVEAFCAHGTGTLYNDAMELTALEAVFGERRFPAFSVKGAIGHTLGAAGGVEAAVCLRALAEKVVPATSGLRNAEPRAAGRVCAEPQSFAGNNVLTTNSGFGGVNAALVLEACS